MLTALVLGGAACVWDDVTRAQALGRFDGVVACNLTGVVWPWALDGWVSLHADHIRLWSAQREKRGLPPHRAVFIHAGAASGERRLSPVITHHTDHCFPGQRNAGTSGLFALKVALVDLGFDRAVLCGMPMSASARHIRDATNPWPGADLQWVGWPEAYPSIKDRARSMGGRTQDLLGAPTADWLKGA